MDRILYTAMSGARQSMEQQAVVSNNLANVSTSGFRAQLHALRAVPVQGDGQLPTRVSVMASTPGADFSAGPVNATGRDLDVALQGNAWLAVQAADGSEAYTRRGDLQVDANGMLTTAGRPVIGQGGPIVVPLGASLSMGADGTLSAIGAGEDPEALAQVGRLKLVDPGETRLVRGEDGLFRAPPDAAGNSAPLPADENARLISGALEGSNVNAVESMVAMIDNARRYEMQIKVIESADENARRADNLLSIE
ncbi:flagellar basal body rod protein FlgF [Microbulbifer thermotolerans]|uniref:Flagellar basal-body rod protein FlgF n=1 Tax=Microbulbifer thermotolerans TaxID=252514 RepID=A0A143HNW5_MICTH|nr:flagellar basal body rod protein FlgF [Microbulbifer thermotolerans]AMX03187.1 flagellar biosynthesis protein FlgF [Microbulbifer thermotolerans]MCX2795882.1 flagellar basal body rod protein FlgF [Microbulbifer thermotolerans]MCX2831944.1 flagellar basal body rod protein FlgF [Microbulbifer thermotolerans]MCX2842491.1 flagellar basal body rod protein FlgF [Microbulbifer thermotolerans]WKT59752.1 flagellar basal body rod protein FlgF [Microbulbifer thermotolerans]